MVVTPAGLGLGQLLLALDRTMVTLVEAPRGLDMPVGSVALVDADDVRLGLAVGPGSVDLFFLLGVADVDALRWLEHHADRPVAIFVKEPTAEAVARAVALGAAVVAVDPRARWEHLYRLVNYALEHHGDRDDPSRDSGTDLFGLAQSIADRTRGMICIEDADSRMLAYSASSEEADELRRLTILGRAGPPEHLEWIGQWGIFDALRAGPDVVRVAERPELGLRPRLAVGIHLPADTRHAPRFAGTIWLQQGSSALADDAEEILRGGSVLAARIMSRLATAPSQHAARLQQLLGLTGVDVDDVGALARELGIPEDARAAIVGFRGLGAAVPADVIALSAGAFRADAQVAAAGDRVYVLLPKAGAAASLTSWVRGVVAALRRELGLEVRAVTAPLTGPAGAAGARADVDRVFDSAERHPGAIDLVTSLDEARTTVLLDEIVSHVAAQPHLVDPRVRRLRAGDPLLAETLQAYLDGFGDIAAIAARLHVHPNTVRYRIRRVEKLLSTSLEDPDSRLVLALGLRATEPR
ncbi:MULTISPECIES: PucR family transcriptional regulator [Mycolicibacterium]|uniref:PucR family transcriptional regulator n=1 Tax=Mycolicibacterium TaxID=1866885 RepID=UPI0005670E9E|nr:MULTISPECIES: PucR family transcriptional regulator [Mycolicibacterium]QZY46470.1 helix-turn-helix domain-containing protein [Mycolicibacterium austroafricanum]